MCQAIQEISCFSWNRKVHYHTTIFVLCVGWWWHGYMLYIYIYIYVCVCVCVIVCVSVFVYVFVYIYVYTHTYTHIQWTINQYSLFSVWTGAMFWYLVLPIWNQLTVFLPVSYNLRAWIRLSHVFIHVDRMYISCLPHHEHGNIWLRVGYGKFFPEVTNSFCACMGFLKPVIIFAKEAWLMNLI